MLEYEVKDEGPVRREDQQQAMKRSKELKGSKKTKMRWVVCEVLSVEIRRGETTRGCVGVEWKRKQKQKQERQH